MRRPGERDTSVPKPSGYFHTNYFADTKLLRTRTQQVIVTVSLGALALFPLISSRYYLNIGNAIALAVLGALALNLLTGVAGQVSIGNVAFMVVGSFTAAIVAAGEGWPVIPTVLLSALIAGAIGLIVGVPALRLRGLYLLIATLALHYIVVYAARKYQLSAEGYAGFTMPKPAFMGAEIRTPTDWFYLLWSIAILAILLVKNLIRSKYGRAWKAIRDRDIAAEIIGVNVARYKVLVFGVSSLLIGFQGALYAYYVRVVDIETFSLELAITYIAMIIIGGLGSVLGAVLGATFVTALPFAVRELATRVPEWVPGSAVVEGNIFHLQTGIYGVFIIGFLLFETRGLAGIWKRVHTYYQLWPFSYERVGAQDG